MTWATGSFVPNASSLYLGANSATHTVDFQIDGAEFELYRAVTSFVKRQSIRAAAEEDNPRARAVGFLMALYQRRLASSTRAMRLSLENRARRLEEGLKKAKEIAQTAPPDLPDPEELDEMEEGDRERLERVLEAISLAGNADQVRLLHLIKEQIKANAADLTLFESWRFDQPPLLMNGGFERARAVFGGEEELERVLASLNAAVFGTDGRGDDDAAPGQRQPFNQ